MIKFLAKSVALVALLFAVSSCGTDDMSGKITGTWELVSFAGRATEADVFVTLNEDNTFALYQRENSLSYTILMGNYVYNEESKIVTGEYINGKAWNNSYLVIKLKPLWFGRMSIARMRCRSIVAVRHQRLCRAVS